MSPTRRGPIQGLVAVDPTARLIAAAEFIEEQIENLPERHQDAWAGRPGHSGWTDVVSEAWDRDGNGHRSFVCQVQENRSADHIVVAVNAMPAVAGWLRAVADFATPFQDPVLEAALPVSPTLLEPALALADQILGGQR